MLNKVTQSLSESVLFNYINLIPNDPMDRVNAELKQKLLKPNHDLLIDIHAHSFNLDYVPRDFEKLVSWLSFSAREAVLNFFNKKLGKYMGVDQPKNIMDNLVDFYCRFFDHVNRTHELLIVNLMMDMDRGISGGSVHPFEHQLEDLLHFLTQEYNSTNYGKFDYHTTVLPFLALDPHNPKLYEQFISCFVPSENYTNISYLDNAAPFVGVKIYPVLGYLPYDPVLMNIFEICEAKQIPITTHCGGYRTRTSHRSIELGTFDKDTNGRRVSRYEKRNIASKKSLKNMFLDPLHWEKVLGEFPNLKLNLAHMGINEDWEKHKNGDIKSFLTKSLRLMEAHPNVYGDISYSFSDAKNRGMVLGLMKDTRYESKIMYGSDFYLAEITKNKTLGSVRDLYSRFKNYPHLWKKLIAENAMRFLFGI